MPSWYFAILSNWKIWSSTLMFFNQIDHLSFGWTKIAKWKMIGFVEKESACRPTLTQPPFLFLLTQKLRRKYTVRNGELTYLRGWFWLKFIDQNSCQALDSADLQTHAKNFIKISTSESCVWNHQQRLLQLENDRKTSKIKSSQQYS